MEMKELINNFNLFVNQFDQDQINSIIERYSSDNILIGKFNDKNNFNRKILFFIYLLYQEDFYFSYRHNCVFNFKYAFDLKTKKLFNLNLNIKIQEAITNLFSNDIYINKHYLDIIKNEIIKSSVLEFYKENNILKVGKHIFYLKYKYFLSKLDYKLPSSYSILGHKAYNDFFCLKCKDKINNKFFILIHLIKENKNKLFYTNNYDFLVECDFINKNGVFIKINNKEEKIIFP